jgi:hypothetical protein
MANDLNSLVAQTSSFSSSMNSAAVASGKAAGGVLDLGKAAFNALNPISKIGNAIGGWRQAIGFIGFGGIVHELEKAKNVLGDIEQAAIGVTRSMGPMKDYPMWQAEIVKGATQLGIEYNEYAQAIQAANKHHAALSMSQKEFLGFTKDAARFGEMVGASASEGAAAFGKLVGESKVGMGVIKNVQHEMLALQNAVGLTGHEMIELLNTGLTPIITQLKLLGESDALINRTTAAVTKLSAQFMAAGFEAGKAAGLVQKLMDPERLTENVMLFNQMGININDAIGAMTGGGGADEMIAKMGDKLPELAKKVASMGMAGVQFAKSLGIPYKDLLQMQNMSSAEAQKAMAAQQAEREKQDQFNKQWEQTMSTWKKWAISLSQAFDQIAIAIMDAFGVKNFKDIKELPLAFGRVFVDFLNAIKFKEIVAIAINVLRMFAQGLQKLMEVIKPALDRLFSGERFQMLSNAVNKLGASFGTMFAKIVDKLPALIDGISKMITYITPWIEQMVNLVAENPKGAIIAILVAKFGGFIMPMIGSILMTFLPTILKGVFNMVTSGLSKTLGLSGGEGIGSLISKIFSRGASQTAGGVLGGASKALGATGIGAIIMVVVDVFLNIFSKKMQGYSWGDAIWKGIGNSLKGSFGIKWLADALQDVYGWVSKKMHEFIGPLAYVFDGIMLPARMAIGAIQILTQGISDFAGVMEDLFSNYEDNTADFTLAMTKVSDSLEKSDDMATRFYGKRIKELAESNNSWFESTRQAGAQSFLSAKQLAPEQQNKLAKDDIVTLMGVMAAQGQAYNTLGAAGRAAIDSNPEKAGINKRAMGTNALFYQDQLIENAEKFDRQLNSTTVRIVTDMKDGVKRFLGMRVEEIKSNTDRALAQAKKEFAAFDEAANVLRDKMNKGLIDPKDVIKQVDKLQQILQGVTDKISASIQKSVTDISQRMSTIGFGSWLASKFNYKTEKAQAAEDLAQVYSGLQFTASEYRQLASGNVSLLQSKLSNKAVSAGMDQTKVNEVIGDMVTQIITENKVRFAMSAEAQEKMEKLNQLQLDATNKIVQETGRGADAAEKTAVNTTPRRPVRMINLNEVAMRANESGANTLTFSRG